MGLMIHLKPRFRTFIAGLFHSVGYPADHMIQGFTKTRKIMTYDSQVISVTRSILTSAAPSFSLLFYVKKNLTPHRERRSGGQDRKDYRDYTW